MSELQKLIHRINIAQKRIQLAVQKFEQKKHETQNSTMDLFKSELDTTIAELESYIEDTK